MSGLKKKASLLQCILILRNSEKSGPMKVDINIIDEDGYCIISHSYPKPNPDWATILKELICLNNKRENFTVEVEYYL